jgi:hypothetical protein
VDLILDPQLSLLQARDLQLVAATQFEKGLNLLIKRPVLGPELLKLWWG